MKKNKLISMMIICLFLLISISAAMASPILQTGLNGTEGDTNLPYVRLGTERTDFCYLGVDNNFTGTNYFYQLCLNGICLSDWNISSGNVTDNDTLYVPYIGATHNVQLGNNALNTTQQISADRYEFYEASPPYMNIQSEGNNLMLTDIIGDLVIHTDANYYHFGVDLTTESGYVTFGNNYIGTTGIGAFGEGRFTNGIKDNSYSYLTEINTTNRTLIGKDGITKALDWSNGNVVIGNASLNNTPLVINKNNGINNYIQIWSSDGVTNDFSVDASGYMTTSPALLDGSDYGYADQTKAAIGGNAFISAGALIGKNIYANSAIDANQPALVVGVNYPPSTYPVEVYDAYNAYDRFYIDTNWQTHMVTDISAGTTQIYTNGKTAALGTIAGGDYYAPILQGDYSDAYGSSYPGQIAIDHSLFLVDNDENSGFSQVGLVPDKNNPDDSYLSIGAVIGSNAIIQSARGIDMNIGTSNNETLTYLAGKVQFSGGADNTIEPTTDLMILQKESYYNTRTLLTLQTNNPAVLQFPREGARISFDIGKANGGGSAERVYLEGHPADNSTTKGLFTIMINNGSSMINVSQITSSNTTWQNNMIVNANITANVFHGNIDWIDVPISATLTGTTACTNLNNLVLGYSYTCQTCANSLTGATIACSTIASVIENCACKVI